MNCGKISRNLIQAQLKCLKDGIDKQLLKYVKIAVEGLYTDTKLLMSSSTRNVKQIISSHISIKFLLAGDKENNHKNRHRKTDTLHKDHITEGKKSKSKLLTCHDASQKMAEEMYRKGNFGILYP